MKIAILKSASEILIAGAALAAMTVPTMLCAQQSKPWEQIPVPKLHEFKPQQPKRIELKNGIVVFLQEDSYDSGELVPIRIIDATDYDLIGRRHDSSPRDAGVDSERVHP